jgi:hypothetical protein
MRCTELAEVSAIFFRYFASSIESLNTLATPIQPPMPNIALKCDYDANNYLVNDTTLGLALIA